jgi:predicted nucleic acid-binding protein
MDVLVDTSIWSLVFRRDAPSPAYSKPLRQMIEENRVKIIGPIRQEVLSGIANRSQFLALKERLQAFDDIQLTSIHYENAAELSNQCRSRGIQGSHTDLLICAVSLVAKCIIFTAHNDFSRYAKVAPINLIGTHDA